MYSRQSPRLLDVQHRAHGRTELLGFREKFGKGKRRPVHILETQRNAVIERHTPQFFHTPAELLGRYVRRALESRPAVKSVELRSDFLPHRKNLAIQGLRVAAGAVGGVEQLRLELGVEGVDGIHLHPRFVLALPEQVGKGRLVLKPCSKENLRTFPAETANDRERVLGQ